MKLQPHQQRVLEELTELEDKIGKLQVFIIGDCFASLPVAEQGRLALQHKIMESYAMVLKQRIAVF